MKDQHQPVGMDFSAIRLRLASPKDIHEWSFGEVTRPETINYRTQKPEKDGLFDERIFGPTKDWECYCGKYKRIRYKGIVCDKCGVEVTRAFVRRERMGHIELAASVTHIWFLRGVPSKIGLLLDLSVQNLEKIVYFASFIVTDVNEELRDETLAQIDEEASQKKKQLKAEGKGEMKVLEGAIGEAVEEAVDGRLKRRAQTEGAKKMEQFEELQEQKMKDLTDAVDSAKKELKDLKPLTILSEIDYQDMSLKYGHVFDAGIGAEAIRFLLEKINLEKMGEELEVKVSEASKNQKRRVVRRLKLVKNLVKNNLLPEWMVLTAIPVIPPDLRPMVPLDGGRYAASDLNDLYRRVINRNNRLKRLKDLNAPEVIQRNEKRMLQEAVDALIDNSKRHGKTVTASTGQRRQLKSLADILKGKQGRFRQNLLGKRVDYSGRSVIVVGPKLRLDQCGLPKKMALELFKPFVIAELIKQELVFNVRSANRFIEAGRPEIWDILEEITEKSHVLLNRAPTLHRLGIQAFQPVLIEGKAIQVHPMVCTAFNADFDGDQMAVHVPLTAEAKREAAEIMLASKNLLKPATGDPIVTPTQDLVLGSYWMTQMDSSENEEKRVRIFVDEDEAMLAYGNSNIHIQEKIQVRMGKKMIETTVGRIIFNEIVPNEFDYQNIQFGKKELRVLISQMIQVSGQDRTVVFLDALKAMAMKYLTFSGISWGISDTPIPEGKAEVMEKAETKVEEVEGQYAMGLLTDEERRAKVIEIWMETKEQITEVSKAALDKTGPVFAMIDSGARGSWGQTTQMMGMKGLVINPAGETIELPIKASFKEGFDVLEYFISTHGARKGLTDTALKTANAGYLTRRLVDVAQDVVVMEADCGTKSSIKIIAEESSTFGETFGKRIWGRYIASSVRNKKGDVIVKRNTYIDDDIVELIEKEQVEEVELRSVLNCETGRGVCQKCYGIDLGNSELVKMGVAVGIIAAQSIGEPGTQLTMRTFHTGGVAGIDITQGLPRVEELFEARPIKKPAVMSDVDGQVEDIVSENKMKTVRVRHIEQVKEIYAIKKRSKLMVKDGENVRKGHVLLEESKGPVKAQNAGNVKVTDKNVLVYSEVEKSKDFPLPFGYGVTVNTGDLITKGQRLSEGSLDLAELLELRGKEEVQKYIINEIKYIYSSQGQPLNEKHVEVIVRQMFERVLIRDTRDTDLVEGDVVSKVMVGEANKLAEEAGGKGALVDPVLLGLTKSSLSTDSFLSAASFQQTSQVLIDAAVSGRVDYLRGLKENVIIGKLIPVGTGFESRHEEMDEVVAAEKDSARNSDDEAPEANDVSEKETGKEEVIESAA